MSLDRLIAAAALTDRWLAPKPPGPYPAHLAELFGAARCATAFAEISRWPGYAASPLRPLAPLAEALELAEIRYQDESGRFGLGSFKALGGAYAVIRYLANRLGVPMAEIREGRHQAAAAGLTVATATDGNHGRSVAWGAQLAGCGCRIYIHRHVSPGRQQAMERFGAEVIRIDGDYDESVRHCAAEADRQDWQVISDTSYGGYRDIPREVMAGYSVIAAEVLEGMGPPPTHVVIQAGVGGLAAAVAARLWMELGERRPRLVVVESDRADCVLASLRAGRPTTVTVSEETVMAGLSCGEVSEVAFAILREAADAAVTIADGQVAPVMRAMAAGTLGGAPIEAGECATPGIIALMAIARDKELRAALTLARASRVLVIGCEGATDPEVYKALLAA